VVRYVSIFLSFLVPVCLSQPPSLAGTYLVSTTLINTSARCRVIDHYAVSCLLNSLRCRTVRSVGRVGRSSGVYRSQPVAPAADRRTFIASREPAVSVRPSGWPMTLSDIAGFTHFLDSTSIACIPNVDVPSNYIINCSVQPCIARWRGKNQSGSLLPFRPGIATRGNIPDCYAATGRDTDQPVKSFSESDKHRLHVCMEDCRQPTAAAAAAVALVYCTLLSYWRSRVKLPAVADR